MGFDVVYSSFKMTDTNIDDAISFYLSGQPIEAAAAKFGLNCKRLFCEIQRRGVQRTKQQIQLLKNRTREATIRRTYADIWDLVVVRYIEGESENALAKAYCVQRSTIRLILTYAGVHVRSQSEAEAIKWSRMDPSARARQVKNAHQAMKGRSLSWAEKCAQSRGKQFKCPNQSPDEVLMAEWLKGFGVAVIPQQSIGAYNADIGAFPVAVEIFGGNFHAYGSHASRFTERSHYFADQGWSLVVVWTYKPYRVLCPDAAEYIVAFRDLVQRDPSIVGEYRMIGGCGEFFAGGRLNCDNLPSVLTRSASLNGRAKNKSVTG